MQLEGKDKYVGHEPTFPAPKLGRTALAERYQAVKAALAEADPFYQSESFWKAFEEGGIDESQVTKLEGMLQAYDEKDVDEQPPAPSAEDAVARLIDRYDLGEIETVQDLADEAEALGVETGNEALLSSVRAFRRFQREDWELAGRGDSDAAEAALIAGMKRARSV